ncbi:helix-turn-helix transcriptional regulator [Pseudarthrobacter sp. NIBRBAC000502772]|uniref:helix-turn-helix domain-containing protein n=1 Tax=Pseudarthrobacter sp. NIBRBAC000502772 TaxID=2590775 RepID=UPI00112FEEE6|nr:helix-turn-helix transcriptional regulator [Pseudarthrobacter sp. NIBRBAC000502772]QDG65808.1 helix-turn-helix transcriptional regulator [Pseudarthrobacter sp. NIBRBAC000502772]
MADVPRGSEPKPGKFAVAISDEVRLAMTRHRVSGSQLAVLAGKSQSYISKRLRNESSFTANDLEVICLALDEDLLALVIRAARTVRGS